MKHHSLAFRSLLLIGAALIATSCKDQPSSPYGTTPTTTGTPNTVTMANMAFSPTSITVPKGTTITFKNTDAYAAHTATSDSATWDTGNVASGQSKSITFAAAGTYSYHCLYHGSMGMTGTVIVQ